MILCFVRQSGQLVVNQCVQPPYLQTALVGTMTYFHFLDLLAMNILVFLSDLANKAISKQAYVLGMIYTEHVNFIKLFTEIYPNAISLSCYGKQAISLTRCIAWLISYHVINLKIYYSFRLLWKMETYKAIPMAEILNTMKYTF